MRLEAEVRTVHRAGPICALTLTAPDLARTCGPGQFLTVQVPGAVVRRPFWIAAAEGDAVRIVFFVGGPTTAWLAAQRQGCLLDVLGPLGRGFRLPDRPVTCLLVGEGPATALRLLAVRLRERGCTVHVVLSARTGARLLEAHRDEPEPALLGPSTVVLTADGSLGRRGDIPGAIGGILDERRPDAVYVAGRPAVMHAVSTLSARRGVDCQAALQRVMACGVGVCWTCVVPMSRPGGVAIVRTCVEGPVLDGTGVRWETLDDPAAAVAAGGIA